MEKKKKWWKFLSTSVEHNCDQEEARFVKENKGNLKMLLQFAWVHVLCMRISSGNGHVRPLIHVGEQQSGTDSGSVVHARTSITMSACTNLEVERTVHPILFGTKYRSQMLRHDSAMTLHLLTPSSKCTGLRLLGPKSIGNQKQTILCTSRQPVSHKKNRAKNINKAS